MDRLMLPLAAVLAACTPGPEETAMRSPASAPETGAQSSDDAAKTMSGAHPADGQAGAAQGPIPDAVSVADNPLPRSVSDTPDQANGRRILSTAFVRVGPDGRLAVELRDGANLSLRNVVMRAGDYCGTRVNGSKPGAQYCGNYGDIVAAWPSDQSAS